MRIKHSIEREVVVDFLEPEKSKAFFVDNKYGWCDSFYHFDDLEDVARSLSLAVADDSSHTHFLGKGPQLETPEGFPDLVPAHEARREQWQWPPELEEANEQMGIILLTLSEKYISEVISDE